MQSIQRPPQRMYSGLNKSTATHSKQTQLGQKTFPFETLTKCDEFNLKDFSFNSARRRHCRHSAWTFLENELLLLAVTLDLQQELEAHTDTGLYPKHTQKVFQIKIRMLHIQNDVCKLRPSFHFPLPWSVLYKYHIENGKWQRQQLKHFGHYLDGICHPHFLAKKSTPRCDTKANANPSANSRQAVGQAKSIQP